MRSSILVASSLPLATTLQLFVIKNGGTILKLPKVEGSSLISKGGQQEKMEIREKDVYVINLYSNQTYVAIIQHPSLSGTGKIYILLLLILCLFVLHKKPFSR